MDRRAFLRVLLASAAAATVDVEQLLWVPRQMVAVPPLWTPNPNIGAIVAKAWEDHVFGTTRIDIFEKYWVSIDQLRRGR